MRNLNGERSRAPAGLGLQQVEGEMLTAEWVGVRTADGEMLKAPGEGGALPKVNGERRQMKQQRNQGERLNVRIGALPKVNGETATDEMMKAPGEGLCQR